MSNNNGREWVSVSIFTLRIDKKCIRYQNHWTNREGRFSSLLTQEISGIQHFGPGTPISSIPCWCHKISRLRKFHPILVRSMYKINDKQGLHTNIRLFIKRYVQIMC